MRSIYMSRNHASRWITLVAFLVAASCRTTEEPEVDRTPPGEPVISLLRAASPDGASTVVISGAAGSVDGTVFHGRGRSGSLFPGRLG